MSQDPSAAPPAGGQPTGSRPSLDRTARLVLIAAALVVTISMGVRQAFGVFLTPVVAELGIGREVFGFAIAVQNLLFGLMQPFIGMIADRFGPSRVVLAGTAAYVAGLVLAASTGSPTGLMVTLGVAVGFGLAGTSFVVVLGAVGRAVPEARRPQCFALVTAGGSFGMFAVVPGAYAMLDAFGWRDAILLLAIAASAMAAFGFALDGARRRGPGGPAAPVAAPPAGAETLGRALHEAAHSGSFWLLAIGFGVCGFQITFIGVHLPAYVGDVGIPGWVAAWALGLIGACNIVGAYVLGSLGARFRGRNLLVAIYTLRTAFVLAVVVLPPSAPLILAFAALFGFTWLGTIPLTSGMVARIFGPRYLSTLYGVVFLSHQVGAFLGAWGGGFAYDLLGSYDAVWAAMAVISAIAALLHLPISDRPVARQPKPA